MKCNIWITVIGRFKIKNAIENKYSQFFFKQTGFKTEELSKI